MAEIRKHYKEIDSLKGFAIFLVVLGHAIVYFPINLHEIPWCDVLFRMLSGIHMPLFFMISGFCFSYRGNYRDFLFKKVKRILIPYFVFNLLDLIPRTLLPQFVNRSQSLAEAVTAILLYGGELWFLYTLFIIFAFYPMIYKWQVKSTRRSLIVMASCLLLALVRIPNQAFTLYQLSGYLFFFTFGVLVKTCNIKFFDGALPRKLLPVGLAVLWLALLFSPWAGPLEVLVSLCGAVACCFLTRLKAFNWIFERFGKFSLQLYLLNGFLLVISRTIICRVTMNPAAIIGFNMLADFGLSYLAIKYICNRFRFFRILMGME